MELVTAVLGDHGQTPKDDYGMPPTKKKPTPPTSTNRDTHAMSKANCAPHILCSPFTAVVSSSYNLKCMMQTILQLIDGVMFIRIIKWSKYWWW
jgi:hypothetical protein